MRIITISLTFTMWVLATTLGSSQETETKSVVIEQLEEKKEDKYRDNESFAGVINNKEEVKQLSKDSVGKVVYHTPDNGFYKVIANTKGEIALEFIKKENKEK